MLCTTDRLERHLVTEETTSLSIDLVFSDRTVHFPGVRYAYQQAEYPVLKPIY